MNTLICMGLLMCIGMAYAASIAPAEPEIVAVPIEPVQPAAEGEVLEGQEQRWGGWGGRWGGGGWGYGGGGYGGGWGGRGWGGHGGWGGGHGGWGRGGWGGYGGWGR